jgi:hypothetical protein
MFTKKLLSIVLLTCMVMLAMGTQFTHALLERQAIAEEVLLLDDGSELAVQELGVAAAPDNNIGYNFVIRNDPETEQRPAVAYNSDRREYLVVWYNDRPGCDDLRAQRVSKEGALIGGAFYISAGCDDNRRNPDVAYNSQAKEYLVVWEFEDGTGFDGIYGRRVSGTGTVLGTSDIQIRGKAAIYTPVSPAVAYASTANRYLVVWAETWHPAPITYEILAQVVTPSGSLEGGTVTVSTSTELREDSDLAYNRARNEFLVVWRQYYGAGDRDIYARRVKMAGGMDVLGDPFSICTLGNDDYAPAVAALPYPASNGQYTVAWMARPSAGDGDIMARQVSGDGSSVSGYMFVAVAEVDELNPAVAGDESGRRYLITWSRSAEPPLGLNYINGRAVSVEGDMGQETNFGGRFAYYPAVAAGPLGDFLVAFEDSALTSNVGIYGQLLGNRVYIPLVLRNH